MISRITLQIRKLRLGIIKLFRQKLAFIIVINRRTSYKILQRDILIFNLLKEIYIPLLFLNKILSFLIVLKTKSRTLAFSQFGILG
jgi:hypothetical protein